MGLYGEQRGAFQGNLFTEPSWNDLASWYEKHCIQNLDKRSTRDNRRAAINAASAYFGSRGITHPDVGAWREYFSFRKSDEETRVCVSTLNTYRKICAHVYSFCRDTPATGMGGWRVLANPLSRDHIPRFKEAEPRPRGLAEPYTTYPLLLQAMKNPLEQAFLSIQRYDLLRIQEVLGVPVPGTKYDRPRHLNLDAGTLFVEYQRDSGRSEPAALKTAYCSATLELHEETVRLLRLGMAWAKQRYATPQGRRVYGFAAQHFVFPFFREQTEDILARLRQVAPADFPKWVRGVDGGDGFHVFRHTGAFELLEGGTPVNDLHRQLRHKDFHTTHVYVEQLRGKTVASDSIREARRVAELKQRRALAERDGKGLRVVHREDE